MRLIGAEGKKLFSSRILCGLFCILLLSSLLLTLLLAQPRPTDEAARIAFDDILTDPEGTQAYYEHLIELDMAHFRDENFSLPHTYLPNSDYDDWSVLNSAFERFDYLSGHSDSLKKIIRSGELRKDDLYSYGFRDVHYEIRAQQSLIDTYGALTDVLASDWEYAYGYDVYLQNDIPLIFIWLFVTAAVSYIFLNDRASGFHAIMKTTRGGRLGSASAKLVTAVSVAAGTTLMFQAVSFLAVGITTGYSSPFAAIQLLPDYESVPYAFSMLSYVAVHLGLRCLAFVIYSLFLSLIASAKPPYLLSFAAGACFTALHMFPALYPYQGTVPAIRYINGASMATGRELLNFWRTVNVFGFPVSHLSALLMLSALAAPILGGAALLLFCRDIRLGAAFRGRMSAFGTRTKHFLRRHLEAMRSRFRPKRISLGMAELKKNRFVLTLLAVAVLLGSYYVSVREQVGTMATYGEALYYRYITELQPMDNDECAAYLAEERARLDDIINAYNRVQNEYETGNMSPDEYFKYLDLYSKTLSENDAFKRVETYIGYLSRKNPDTGVEGKILYTSGYEKFFDLSSNLLLYAALILFAAKAFTVEYGEGDGFARILRTTAKGREAVLRKKLIFYAGMGSLFALIFRAAAFWAVSEGYIMTNMGTVLHSIPSFSNVDMGIRIRQYLLLDFFLQALFGGMLSLFICAISFFCRKMLPTLSAALLITGVPEALVRIVLQGRPEISPLSLTAPAKLLNRSAVVRLFASDIAYLLVLTAAFTVTALILILLVRRSYVDSKTTKRRKRQ